jgi:hypothetical protein
MKNTLFPVLSAVLISATANAQTDTTAKPETDTTKPVPVDTTATSFRLMNQSSYAAYAMSDTTKPGDTTQPQPTDSTTTFTQVHVSAHAAYAMADTTKPGDTTKPEAAAAMQTDATTEATTGGLVTLDSNLPEHLKGVTSTTVRPEHYLPVLGSYQSSDAAQNSVSITVDEQNVGIVWIDGLAQGRIKALLKKSPATYKIPAQTTAEGKSVGEGVLYYDPATKEVAIALGSKFNDEDPTAPITANAKTVVYKGSKQDQMAAATTETAPAQQ